MRAWAPLSTVCISIAVGLGLNLGIRLEIDAVPSESAHPLVHCSVALSSARQAVEAENGPIATEHLDAAESISDCDRLGTTAGRTYLRGRIALLEGRPEQAVDAFRRAESAPEVRVGDRPFASEILYYAGLAQELLGNHNRARELYSRLASEYPADARVALVLPLLEEAGATTPTERLEAAVQAIDNHNYSAAERLLSQVVLEELGQPVDAANTDFQHALREALAQRNPLLGEATYQLGYLWYYWIRRENLRAIPLLSAVAESRHERRADASYYLARSYMRAEEYDSARLAWLDFGERFRSDSRAHETDYYSGWLYLDREQFEQAIPGFVDYLEHYPRGRRRYLARWYLGWAHYRLGQCEQARRQFHELATTGGYLRAAKGAYWEARCLREEGREQDAVAVFTNLADRYAFTYYGLMARQQLGDDLVPPRSHVRPLLPTQRVAELVSTDRRIDTLSQLLDVGDPFHVARYYEWTDPDRRVDSTLDRLLIQQAAGDAYDEFRDSRGHSGSLLRRPPTSDSLLHWVRRFPRPYDRWLEPIARELGVDPLLIWSIMQIESHYNGRFVSYADAQGLLQLIPRTGQNVAAALNDPYAEGVLMHAPTNLRYGTWYLSALQREFRGQLPLTIGSYNSGAGSMHRWVAENHDLPFDAFVEEIPYDQSREYVKKVIGMYAHYLYLYAEDEQLAETLPRLLPDRIDPDVLGEIDW